MGVTRPTGYTISCCATVNAYTKRKAFKIWNTRYVEKPEPSVSRRDSLWTKLEQVRDELDQLLKGIPEFQHHSLDMILDPQSSEDQEWKHRVHALQKREQQLVGTLLVSIDKEV